MGKVLGINYFGDLGAMLGSRVRDVYHSRGFEKIIKETGGSHYAPASLEEIAEITDAQLGKGTPIVSGDHSVSHPVFGTIDRRRSRFDIEKGDKVGALILGQHVDGYKSYGGLCRANVIRRLVNDGLVDHVVIAGVRPSEYAIFTGDQKDRSGLPYFNRLVARRYLGEFDGLHENLTVIPMTSIRDLPDAVDRGMKELAKRGIVHVGLDFDADVLDSGGFTGVGYSLNALNKFKFPERQFIESQLHEGGMPSYNLENQMSAIRDVLHGHSGKSNLVSAHLAEIEPENENPTTGSIQNTSRLVRAFAGNF